MLMYAIIEVVFCVVVVGYGVAVARHINSNLVKIACATSHGHGADPLPYSVRCLCNCHRVTP